ncbi:WG repeat-containing protein [Tenacibaculum sp. Bg11-29]|uniref:WG repeat-containing protein n=1 Tax=Tenacibaculum sp. Bg11-29 TaxID=2058306 RepID=UPI0018E2AE73|nr:WG repeat-containing protein [Tenacibaculum sp. Bg11-29]
MKQIITLLIILIFNISCSQETKEETFDIEKIKLTEKEKIELNNVLKYYKNFTIKEIKANFEESITAVEDGISNEKEYIFDKDSLVKEEYSLPFQLYLKGIKKQVEALKKSTFLIQNFKNDSIYLRFDTKNRFYTHSHEDKEVFKDIYTLKKKYLNTQKIDTTFNKEAFFNFGYFNINFGKAKYIDSLLITANINYTKSYDTIVFSKKEILKNKEGIIIRNISNNYIHFENNKNVNFFKLEAYNSNGRKLKKKKSRNYSPNTIRKYNKELLKILEKAYQNIKNIDNHQKIKEEIKKIKYKIILLNRKHNGSQYSFHGNIDKIKFYIEKERESLDFDFIARNKYPSTFYLNELKVETLVMNTKNELLFTIPDTNFEYLKYDSFNKRNTFYLAKDNNDEAEQYYYLNVEKQIFKKVVHVEALSENLVKAELEEEDNYFYAIFNSNKENVSGFKYLDIVVEKYNEEFYIIAQKKDKTYTFINNKGEEIGTKGLTNIRTSWFKYAPIVSAIKNNKIGFVDKNGETKVPFIYDIYNKQFSDLEMKKNNLFGLMGLNGKLSIPLIYNKLERFYNNLYIVTKNGYQGIVDINNKIILPIKYKIWKNDLEDLHLITCNSKAGYISKEGKIIIPEIYKKDGSDNFSHGFAQVCRTEDNKCAIINEKNEVIIPWTDATINYKYHEGKRTYTIGSKTYNYLLQLIE